MNNRSFSDSLTRMIGRAPHTGAMIALAPTDRDAERLEVDGYEPAEVLHVTLAFLGSSNDWSDEDKLQVQATAARLASMFPPADGMVWARAELNPTTADGCAAYLVGGEDLTGLHGMAMALAEGYDTPPQHSPWVPHMTIGYGLESDELMETGTAVEFDRLRVSFGEGDVMDFPLTGVDED